MSSEFVIALKGLNESEVSPSESKKNLERMLNKSTKELAKRLGIKISEVKPDNSYHTDGFGHCFKFRESYEVHLSVEKVFGEKYAGYIWMVCHSSKVNGILDKNHNSLKSILCINKLFVEADLFDEDLEKKMFSKLAPKKELRNKKILNVKSNESKMLNSIIYDSEFNFLKSITEINNSIELSDFVNEIVDRIDYCIDLNESYSLRRGRGFESKSKFKSSISKKTVVMNKREIAILKEYLQTRKIKFSRENIRVPISSKSNCFELDYYDQIKNILIEVKSNDSDSKVREGLSQILQYQKLIIKKLKKKAPKKFLLLPKNGFPDVFLKAVAEDLDIQIVMP